MVSKMIMENNLDFLPPVKRARGYRVYSESRRFVDLYLDGGRAVLGHNAPSVLRELKNAAERSLFAPYPSYYTGRFEKALSLLFPGKSFAVYGAIEAVPSAIRDTVPVRRPYMEGGCASFLAVLPHPLAPLVLVYPAAEGVGGVRDEGSTGAGGFPRKISPVVMALTTRAIYDVLHNPERGRVVFRQVDAVLAKSLWRQEGIYLSLKERVSDEEWTRVFRRFLDAGFLVPPTQEEPLVLPGELSHGEEKLLAECLQNFEG
jgi:hypothetical protein